MSLLLSNWMFIVIITRTHDWSLTWASWLLSIPSFFKIHFNNKKLEATGSSKLLVNIYQTIWRNVPGILSSIVTTATTWTLTLWYRLRRCLPSFLFCLQVFWVTLYAYVSSPSNSRFDNANNISCRTDMMQFHPPSCEILSLSSEYSHKLTPQTPSVCVLSGPGLSHHLNKGS